MENKKTYKYKTECGIEIDLTEDLSECMVGLGYKYENFEYKAAKQAQNRNRSRIRYLERMIKSAHVIEDKAGADEVGLFDKVELLFEDDDDTDTIQVVTTVRCDPLNGRISCKAPLGKAVLGKKVGDQVDVTTEGGDSYTVVIKSITKEKDDGSGPIL